MGGGEATPATGTAATLMDRLDDASPTRRREMLLAFVAEQVAQVLAAPSAAAIDSRQPLNELGLDSLMAVELRNRLGRGWASRGACRRPWCSTIHARGAFELPRGARSIRNPGVGYGPIPGRRRGGNR